MKTCLSCKNIFSLDAFYARRVGHYPRCKPCHKQYVDTWRKANPEKYSGYVKKWQKANPEKVIMSQKKYWAKNPGRLKHKWSVKRLKRNKSMLGKLFQRHISQIIEIYENCSKGYHVDHIIPLRGTDVSGLHVPWNLQYLTPTENRKKGNRVA